MAQRHADQCVFDHDCAKCRSPAPHLHIKNIFVALKCPSENFGLCHGFEISFWVDFAQVSLYFRSVDRWGVGQNLYIYKQVLVKIFAKKISRIIFGMHFVHLQIAALLVFDWHLGQSSSRPSFLTACPSLNSFRAFGFHQPTGSEQ